MRDVATLVWVVLLVIGVISSMVASVRRRMNAQPIPSQGAPPPPAAVQQLQQQPREQLVAQMKQVSPRPAAPAPPAPPAAPGRGAPAPSPPAARTPAPSAPARVSAARGLFPGRRALVRAVIAAEVLGKPRALNDEYFRS